MGNLFEYNKKNNDLSIEVLREKEKFFDMEEASPIIYSDSLHDLCYEIFCDNNIINNFEFKEDKKNIKYVLNSKKIWDNLNINLKDIVYLNKEYNFNKFKGILDKEFSSSLIVDSPYAIPISFVDNFYDTQIVATHLTLRTGKCVIFRNILLPMFEKKVNSVIYAHEITHTQLENVLGGAKNITNTETLPMVIEQLFADKYNILELIRNNRLIYLALGINELINNKDMDFSKRITFDTYITSTFQSFDLANKYFNGNESVKKEMISYINSIFEGNKDTEDMLDKFDANFDSLEYKLSKILKK